MAKPCTADIFCEDRGHEQLIVPLLKRIFSEQSVLLDSRVVTARGGAGKVSQELKARIAQYERGGLVPPDLLVVAWDANSRGYAETHRLIEELVGLRFRNRLVTACPDPYVERWYLADQNAFVGAVGGHRLSVPRRDKPTDYKSILRNAIRDAKQIDPSGGIAFGPQIAADLDFHRLGSSEPSFEHFVSQLKAVIKGLKAE